ncbi:putative signal transducing protein [Thiolapillus brandeum]|uniref:putative signal transducing protein n=1 Tax=Thiolapillus brandeum TaxID=1076588 RepID=UPI000597077E|nr:DUF2007 domain-containing protein [Thiolapillus brandeum]
MGLVTIYTYDDHQLATLAKMKLESEGIPSHIHSSGMLRLTGLTNALGGVRLQVSKADSEKALEIIKKFNSEIGLDI